MLKVLFLCTGNSCRSQMAEGWARHLKCEEIEAYSAGIERHGLNPNAVKVMAEVGVDISSHQSQHLDELRGIEFDHVVTVCGHAHESCPVFPGRTKVTHVGFDDPPRLAKDAAGEEEALVHYRRVRDEIRSFVETLPEAFMTRIRFAFRKRTTRDACLNVSASPDSTHPSCECVGHAASRLGFRELR